MQERLNESEQRMTDIINFLPDAMFAINTDGRVLVWNRAIERMTGIMAEDIIGRDNYEYALPFYNERRPVLADLVLNYDRTMAGRYDNLVKNGETLTAQVYLPHFRGNHGIHAWFTAAPLYDTRGTIAGAIETIRDITEFEQARQALQQGRDRYEGIINNSREGVIITRKGHIVFANPFIRSILAGYTTQELSGKTIADLIHPADRDVVQTISDAQHATATGPDIQRFRGIARDGSYRNLECRAVLIEWEGHPASAWFISEIQKSTEETQVPISRASN
jgi:PAS domain S-box-containing protein